MERDPVATAIARGYLSLAWDPAAPPDAQKQEYWRHCWASRWPFIFVSQANGRARLFVDLHPGGGPLSEAQTSRCRQLLLPVAFRTCHIGPWSMRLSRIPHPRAEALAAALWELLGPAAAPIPMPPLAPVPGAARPASFLPPAAPAPRRGVVCL